MHIMWTCVIFYENFTFFFSFQRKFAKSIIQLSPFSEVRFYFDSRVIGFGPTNLIDLMHVFCELVLYNIKIFIFLHIPIWKLFKRSYAPSLQKFSSSFLWVSSILTIKFIIYYALKYLSTKFFKIIMKWIIQHAKIINWRIIKEKQERIRTDSL